MNDPPNATHCFLLKMVVIQAGVAHPSAASGVSRIVDRIRESSPLLARKVDIDTTMTEEQLDAALAAQTNVTSGASLAADAYR